MATWRKGQDSGAQAKWKQKESDSIKKSYLFIASSDKGSIEAVRLGTVTHCTDYAAAEHTEGCYSEECQGTWSHGFWQYSQYLSLSPGKPNRDQWGSWMNQSYSSVQVFVFFTLPVMWPAQKRSETLTIWEDNRFISRDHFVFLPRWQRPLWMHSFFSGVYRCFTFSISWQSLQEWRACYAFHCHVTKRPDRHHLYVWPVVPASQTYGCETVSTFPDWFDLVNANNPSPDDEVLSAAQRVERLNPYCCPINVVFQLRCTKNIWQIQSQTAYIICFVSPVEQVLGRKQLELLKFLAKGSKSRITEDGYGTSKILRAEKQHNKVIQL